MGSLFFPFRFILTHVQKKGKQFKLNEALLILTLVVCVWLMERACVSKERNHREVWKLT